MNRIVLCGNPNTGKTTIFNALTRSKERVGNFHGVTVDKKVKQIIIGNTAYEVVDLPGIYSLEYYTIEEKVSTDYLTSLTQDDIIIFVADMARLRRNLYLYTQLKEIGYHVIICFNRTDKTEVNIDFDKFKKLCSDGFFEFSYKTIKKDIAKIISEKHQPKLPDYMDKISGINEQKNFNNLNYREKSEIIKKCENSEKYIENCPLSENSTLEKIIKTRFFSIDRMLNNSDYSVKIKNRKIDEILTNKVKGTIIFFSIVFLIFYLTFGVVGNKMTEFFENVSDKVFYAINEFMTQRNFSPFFTKFIAEGIYLGISVIISFLPQLSILFICFSILEESGYISRLCFIADDFLMKFGLNGKSVFTIFLSFGCSTSSAYQARTNKDLNTKRKLSMITPYFSCSAKIPVYLLIVSIFFKRIKIIVLAFLYLLGIIIAFCILSILNKVSHSEEDSFILEIPSLKVPPMKNIIFSSFRQVIDFFVKIGSLIIVFNIIIWIATNCNFRLIFTNDITESILYNIGDKLSFIFIPLGFGIPCYVVALLSGFMAKEIIISTLTMFSATTLLQESIVNPESMMFLTTAGAISFLVFVALYCPCISNFLVIRQEAGKRSAYIGLIIQFTTAYIISFITYQFMLADSTGKVIMASIVALTIMLTFIIMKFVVRKRMSRADNTVN